MCDYFNNFEDIDPYDYELTMSALRTKVVCRKWLLNEAQHPIPIDTDMHELKRNLYEAYNHELNSLIEQSLNDLETLDPDDPKIINAMRELYERCIIDEEYETFEKIILNAPEIGTAEIIERINNFRHNISSKLTNDLLPHASRGKKTAERYEGFRSAHKENREKEWQKYPTWLDEYFSRNPDHSLTEGRRACGNNFRVTRKTIERRTKGYTKRK